MERGAIMKQLDDHGFCVIPNVIPTEKCDEYLSEFQKWHIGFEEGERMKIRRSVIQSYRIGHFEAAWKARLHTKPVFAKIWETEKLFTSVDGVAVANPPESGTDDFRKPDDNWCHLDQGARRQGRHGYQGAVYLEETTEKDYCFRVLSDSHKYHTEFFTKFPKVADKTKRSEFHRLSKTQIKFYEDRGCVLTYVPVPKGGMVLWDSRTVHDTQPPEEDREDLHRWRCVVFVCMTPAIWASKEDLAFKRQVYENLELTSHWSSQGQKSFERYNLKRGRNGQITDTHSILEIPEVAKSPEVKYLMGINGYDFNDGQPNGPPSPIWID